MRTNPLGRKIKTAIDYDRKLLFFIPRKNERRKNNIDEKIFTGYDLWNAYEFGYLDKNGIPQNRILRIVYPADSANIVESKSLKLYLGSFAMTKFNDDGEPAKIIMNDLKDGLKAEYLDLAMKNQNDKMRFTKIPGKLLLDGIGASCTEYELSPGLLKVKKTGVKKTVEHYSHALKTNCPVTGQPDLATVYIRYNSGTIVEPGSLLEYIVSYRTHSGYHESCCESIFRDIYELIKPGLLIVKCFYTRRGGIDINPARFYGVKPDNKFDLHYWRQ